MIINVFSFSIRSLICFFLMKIQERVGDAFIAPIIDFLPNAILWLAPVHNTNGILEDFEIGYANKATATILHQTETTVTALRVLRDRIPSTATAESFFS